MNRESMQRFFSQTRTESAPWEKVARADEWFRDHPRPNVYVGTSLTSGGYARVIPKSAETIGQIKELNADLAAQYITLLQNEGHLNGNHVVMYAGDIGEIPGWREIDYLLVWLSLMKGISGKAAKEIEEIVRPMIDPRMNDHSLSHDERRPYYDQLVHRFNAAVWSVSPQGQPVGQVIQLLGARSSLGCQAEAHFARLSGIPVYEALIGNVNAPAFERLPNRDDVIRELGILAQAGVTIYAQGLAVSNPDRAIHLQPMF